MLKLKPIKTYKDYRKALKTIDVLWDAEQNTHEGDCLEILITLTEKYKSEHFLIESPDPIEAIKI